MKITNENTALAALCLCMLMPSLDTSIANAALPALSQSFGASFQAVQWIVLAYLLTVTALIVVAGRLGDMIGWRRLLLAGIGLFTLASIGCGMAPALWMLIAARALQGLGAATMLALAMASVGDAVPKEKTGRAMGLLGSMSAIGTTIGPALGGLLLASLGWRAIFLVNVPLGLLTFALAWHTLPRPLPSSLPVDAAAADRQPPQSGALPPVRFDHAGMLLLAVSLVAYALAMTIGHGQFGMANLALLLVAALGCVLFVRVEAKAPSPLIQLALFRNRTLRAGLIMSLLVSTVMMSTLVVGPFYLTRALGLGVARVGLVLSLGPLVAALWGVPAGRLAERFGTRRMVIAGLGGMAVACLALALQPAAWGLAAYIPAMLVMTASYAQFQAANNTALMSDIQPGQRGVLSALLGLSRNLGLVTGVAVMGGVFAFITTRLSFSVGPECAVVSGTHGSFAMALILTFFALIAGCWNTGSCWPCNTPSLK